MNATLLRLALASLFLTAPLAAAGAQVNAHYEIAQRRIAPSPPTLAVTRGDQVRIDWRSDEAATLHLHGYDVTLQLAPAREGQMNFKATVLGRFPVSAHGFGKDAASHGRHHGEAPLLFVEVRPE